MTRVATGWLALMLSSACHASSTTPDATAHRRTVIDDMDRACLAEVRPGEVADFGDVPGFSFERRGPGSGIYEGPGEEPFEGDLAPLLDDLRRTVHDETSGVRMTGLGACPERVDGDGVCIRVTLGICTTPPDVLVARYAEVIATRGMDRYALSIGVELTGRLGPRCESGCEPEPSRRNRTAYDPEGSRDPVLLYASGGRCAHDGECMVRGCGNRCLPWYDGTSFSTCEGFDVLGRAYCGCIEQQCTFFTQ